MERSFASGGIIPGISVRSSLDDFDNRVGTFESELDEILGFELMLQGVVLSFGGSWVG